MHVINFLVAIFLPYISFFSTLSPPGTVPPYFYSETGAFVAGEFGAVVFFWAGFLRNSVQSGKLSEQKYFAMAALMLFFICASKIIFTLPMSWITSMFAFGLGVLAMPRGQSVGKKSLIVLYILSAIIFLYSTFILLGMAWFDFEPQDYYYYKNLILDFIYQSWHMFKSFLKR